MRVTNVVLVLIFIAVVKNLSSSTPPSKPEPEKGKLFMGEMKLGDVKSIASIKKSGLAADLTISVKKFNIHILS